MKWFTWVKNELMVIVAMAIVLAVVVPGLAAEMVDRVVAVVNDDPIVLSELNREIKPYMEQIKQAQYPLEKQRQLIFKVRADVLEQLINRKLTDQEIARFGISVSDEELNSTIERIKESAFSTDEEMRAALGDQGLAFEEYQSRIRQQLLRRKLINSEVRSRTVITKEDIRAYYDSHPELFAGETKYHLKNILIQVPETMDEDQKHRIRLQMEGLHQALLHERSFDELMKAVSDTAPQAMANDLGEFSFDSLSMQLQEALKGKQSGAFTGVLDTDQGFQIIYIQEIIQSPGKSLEEASSSIEEKLFNEIVDKKFESWLEKLKKRSYIKIIQ
ncbi:MAG: SurA N-terminal domain-containing protein [Desulfobacterales bacterium]|nr:SurA N-terminal domain-containing protein [Desulfobacterales bacterium]